MSNTDAACLIAVITAILDGGNTRLDPLVAEAWRQFIRKYRAGVDALEAELSPEEETADVPND